MTAGFAARRRTRTIGTSFLVCRATEVTAAGTQSPPARPRCGLLPRRFGRFRRRPARFAQHCGMRPSGAARFASGFDRSGFDLARCGPGGVPGRGDFARMGSGMTSECFGVDRGRPRVELQPASARLQTLRAQQRKRATEVTDTGAQSPPARPRCEGTKSI